MTFNELKQNVLLASDKEYLVTTSFKRGHYILMEQDVAMHLQCATAQEVLDFVKANG